VDILRSEAIKLAEVTLCQLKNFQAALVFLLRRQFRQICIVSGYLHETHKIARFNPAGTLG
jgi:hypothetical protein